MLIFQLFKLYLHFNFSFYLQRNHPRQMMAILLQRKMSGTSAQMVSEQDTSSVVTVITKVRSVLIWRSTSRRCIRFPRRRFHLRRPRGSKLSTAAPYVNTRLPSSDTLMITYCIIGRNSLTSAAFAPILSNLALI